MSPLLRRSFLFLINGYLLLLGLSCASVKPQGVYTEFTPPPAPDYANSAHWAALPEKRDSADRTPAPHLDDLQNQALVDVFFLHPTTYTGKRGEKLWNAPIDHIPLNKKTDAGSILNQASIFNGAGRVYAPRYRQAHLNAYYTKDKASARQAFALAYQDVKAAFEYYLENYNDGRPIIIAAHSQGTTHAKQILQEYFDGKALQEQLVVAYLVGMPIAKDDFPNIKVCESPEEFTCFCTWRTWQKKHTPKKHQSNNNIVVTNPLIWTTETSYAAKDLNEGAVLRKFERSYYPKLADAQVHNGLLWVTKPRFPGSFFVWFKNYHIADFNLYYTNVRINAQERTAAYLKKKATPQE